MLSLLEEFLLTLTDTIWSFFELSTAHVEMVVERKSLERHMGTHGNGKRKNIRSGHDEDFYKN